MQIAFRTVTAGIVAAVLLFAPVRCLAQPGKTTTRPAATIAAVPFAVVDVVRIFDECDQIKDLNSMLRTANQKFQKEAEQRKQVLAQKETELNAFSPDSPDYVPRRNEFSQLNIQANVWLQTKRTDLQRDHFNWTRTVYEELSRSVAEVAHERGLVLVMQKREFKPEFISDDNTDNLRQMIHQRMVIYTDDSLDITEAVIKKMNARYREHGGRAKLNVGGSEP